MIEPGEKICPFCFTVFAPGVLDDDYPFCRECGNFGRSILVEPTEEFIAQTKESELQALLESWYSREKFLDAEKSMITGNLEKLISFLHQDSTG